MQIRLLLLFLSLSLLLPEMTEGTPESRASARFLLNETGVRANGMGNAFTAVANDMSSIFLNPAGLSAVPRWGVHRYKVHLFPGPLHRRAQGSSLK